MKLTFLKEEKGMNFVKYILICFKFWLTWQIKSVMFILFVKTPCVHPIVFCDIYFDFEGLVTSVTTKQNVWS